MTPDTLTIEHFRQALPIHVRHYLNGRGIPDLIIDRFHVGWNGERITIPVYDRDGALVLYKLGKAPDDPTDSPKMLYYPKGSSAELYGWDTLRKNPSSIVVCEGEYDRLVLEANGFCAATGTSGAATFKETWAKEISTVPEVHVCYDHDAAGRAGAERVARLIPHARIVVLPPEVGEGGDVTDYFIELNRTPDDFRRLLDEARPLPAGSATPPARPMATRQSKSSPDIRRLKEAVRIEEVIREYVHLSPSGKTLMARCCFHEDRVPSLAVFPDTQTFHCFGCGKGGDTIEFLMEVERLSFRDVIEVLKRLSS